MVFQIFYLAFGFSRFQTHRTKMAVVELNVAQRTQKPTAGRTGDGRLFARVIKATGFFLSLQWISGLAGGQFTQKRRVNIRACRFLTCRTGDQRKGVDRLRAERCFALGARKQKLAPEDLFLSATPPQPAGFAYEILLEWWSTGVLEYWKKLNRRRLVSATPLLHRSITPWKIQN